MPNAKCERWDREIERHLTDLVTCYVFVLCAVENITVEDHGTATLNCKASSNVDVRWTQTDTFSYVYDIYSDGAILEGIRNRFSIKTTTRSEYNLVMLRANPSDAGLYVCDESNPADGSRMVLSQYFVTVLGKSVVLFLYFSLCKFLDYAA